MIGTVLRSAVIGKTKTGIDFVVQWLMKIGLYSQPVK